MIRWRPDIRQSGYLRPDIRYPSGHLRDIQISKGRISDIRSDIWPTGYIRPDVNVKVSGIRTDVLIQYPVFARYMANLISSPEILALFYYD